VSIWVHILNANTNAKARPTIEPSAVLLTPVAAAALPAPPAPAVELVPLLLLPPLPALVDPFVCCWVTAEIETPLVVTHSVLFSGVAEERKVMSAHCIT
jgi:hypothetical protein